MMTEFFDTKHKIATTDQQYCDLCQSLLVKSAFLVNKWSSKKSLSSESLVVCSSCVEKALSDKLLFVRTEIRPLAVISKSDNFHLNEMFRTPLAVKPFRNNDVSIFDAADRVMAGEQVVNNAPLSFAKKPSVDLLSERDEKLKLLDERLDSPVLDIDSFLSEVQVASELAIESSEKKDKKLLR